MKSSALIVTGTKYSSPLSSYNQYFYRGCYTSNSNTIISQITLTESTTDLIDTCYLYALNYLSYPATFFGLKNGNVCVFGYDNSLTSGLLISSDVLTDNQCYQDCNSIFNDESQSASNSSNLPKCGSKTTVSIYQLSNTPKALEAMTKPSSALALANKVTKLDVLLYT